MSTSGAIMLLAAAAALIAQEHSAASAPLPVSLDEVVARALVTSPLAGDIGDTIELAGLDLQRARARFRLQPYAFINTDARSGAQIGQSFRTGVTRRFASGAGWTAGASNQSFGDSYLSELTVGYTLPLFQNALATGRYALADAELNYRTREQLAELATGELVLQVIAAYYEVALAMNQVEVAAGAAMLAEDLARATAIRVRTGRSSALDQRQADLRLAESLQRRQSSEAGIRMAEQRLRLLAGIPMAEPLAIDPEIPLTADRDALLLQEDSLAELALGRRRDIAALREESEGARRKLIGRSARMPGVNLSVQYARVGVGTSFGESTSLDEGRIGVGLSMDLGGDDAFEAEARQLFLQYRARQRALARLEAEITTEVHASLHALREFAGRQRLAREQRVLAQQQLRLAETLYLQGSGTTEDMLERQQRVAETRQQELVARVEHLLSHYRLLAATGSLLEQWRR